MSSPSTASVSSPAPWTAGRRILAAIPQGWRNRGSARWWMLALAVLLLALPGLALAMAGLRAAWTTLLVALLCLQLGAWVTLVYGLMLQNTAAAARLVPTHARRLRQVLAAAWCLGLAAVAGVAALNGSPVLVVTATMAVAMAWLALLVRWPVQSVLLILLPSWFGIGWGPWLRRTLQAPVNDFTVPAALLAAGLVAWLLGGLLGTGGQAHARRMARLGAWRGALDRGTAPSGGAGEVWSWISRMGSRPYGLAMARLLREPAPPVWPRLMLVFGPASHWQVHAAWAIGLGCVAIAAVAWLHAAGHLGGGQTLAAVQLMGPLIGLASASISPVTGLLTAVVRTRREQGLVALLPGVPRGAALNRGLALRWLLHFGVAWSFLSALTLGLVWWSAPELLWQCAAGLAGLWPLAAIMCTDLSRLPAQPGAAMQLPVVGLIVGPVLAVVAHAKLGWPLVAVVAGMGLITSGLLGWRWRALLRRPGAFPACRLA